MARYTYSTGHKTRDAAAAALEDMFAFDEVSECERPRIEAYEARLKPETGKGVATATRYCITLLDA